MAPFRVKRNVLLAPRDREAMIGRGPSVVSRSECAPTLSLPSAYKLASAYDGFQPSLPSLTLPLTALCHALEDFPTPFVHRK